MSFDDQYEPEARLTPRARLVNQIQEVLRALRIQYPDCDRGLSVSRTLGTTHYRLFLNGSVRSAPHAAGADYEARRRERPVAACSDEELVFLAQLLEPLVDVTVATARAVPPLQVGLTHAQAAMRKLNDLQG